jgi:hypothetical protein
MKKLHKTIFTLILTMVGNLLLHAQQPIIIAATKGDVVEIIADTTIIKKAMKRTLADGTNIERVSIIETNQSAYLVGEGRKQNYFKMIVVELKYDMQSRNYSITQEMHHYSCASAACSDCKPHFEAGKMIACICREQMTASNQCSFGKGDRGLFFQSMSHFVRINSSK